MVSSNRIKAIPNFVQIDLLVQELKGRHTHTDRQHGDLIELLFYLLRKGSRLKKET
jgi:hypothetical protein